MSEAIGWRWLDDAGVRLTPEQAGYRVMLLHLQADCAGGVLLTRWRQVLLLVPDEATVFGQLLSKPLRVCCAAHRMCCGTQCQQGQKGHLPVLLLQPQHTAYAIQIHACDFDDTNAESAC
jgi:hypothetical protein